MILPTTQTNAHKLIAIWCVERAHEIYEENATRYDSFAKLNPDRTAYVNRIAPTLVAEARRELSAALADPHLPDEEKQAIFDALMLDSSIPQSKKRGRFRLPVKPSSFIH